MLTCNLLTIPEAIAGIACQWGGKNKGFLVFNKIESLK